MLLFLELCSLDSSIWEMVALSKTHRARPMLPPASFRRAAQDPQEPVIFSALIPLLCCCITHGPPSSVLLAAVTVQQQPRCELALSFMTSANGASLCVMSSYSTVISTLHRNNVCDGTQVRSFFVSFYLLDL